MTLASTSSVASEDAIAAGSRSDGRKRLASSSIQFPVFPLLYHVNDELPKEGGKSRLQQPEVKIDLLNEA